MILLAFPAERIHSAIPTIKVPGPYPYETPVRVPAPAISESSVLPTPAPYPYAESSPSLSAAPDHASRTVNGRRPVTAKAVREAAFKYNGVPDFCEFLAALPANVSVFDPNARKDTDTCTRRPRNAQECSVARQTQASAPETKRPNARLSRRTRDPEVGGFDQPCGCRQSRFSFQLIFAVQNWIANVTIPRRIRIVFLVSSVIGRECCIWRGDLSCFKCAGIAVAVSRCPRESFNDEDDDI